jgi:hypothetical protein
MSTSTRPVADPSVNGASSKNGVVAADLAALIAGGLEPIVPDFLERSDGAAIGYRGQLHWVQGEPESGKSWLAILACLRAVMDGERAAYVDYETSAVRFLLRLQALGASWDAVIERMTYVQPVGSVRDQAESLAALFAGRAVVAVDACTAAMTAEGLNPDKAMEVDEWLDRLPRIAVREGAATFVVDHVVKSRDDRGRWATGSGHKLAASDVAFSLSAVHLEPFGVGLRGRSWVHVAKDRDGGIRALADPKHGTVADIVLDATESPVRLTLEPPSGAPVKESNADRIWALLPAAPETITADVIAEAVGITEKSVRRILLTELKLLGATNVANGNERGRWCRPDPDA